MYGRILKLSAAVGLTAVGYERWKGSVRQDYASAADELVQQGFKKYQISSVDEKRRALPKLRATLTEYWEKKGVDPAKVQGADKRLTLTNPDYEYPALWAEADAQGAIIAMLDPSFSGAVTFGEKTHWKLRLLIGGPVWLAAPSRVPRRVRTRVVDSIAGDPEFARFSNVTAERLTRFIDVPSLILSFDPRSWILLSQPVPESRPFAVDGCRLLAHNLHFDGWGLVNDIFGSNGLATPTPNRLVSFEAPAPASTGVILRPKALVLRFLSQLLAFQLHYANDADIGVPEGTTSLIPGSHGPLMQALADSVSSGPDGAPSPPWAHPFKDLRARLVHLTTHPQGAPAMLKQYLVRKDESIVVIGPLIHGTARADRLPDDGFSRLCVNPKMFARPLTLGEEGSGASTPEGPDEVVASDLRRVLVDLGVGSEDAVKELSSTELELLHVLLSLPRGSPLHRLLSSPRSNTEAAVGGHERFDWMRGQLSGRTATPPSPRSTGE